MYQTKALRNLLPLTLSCLIGTQEANAELNISASDSQMNAALAAATTPFEMSAAAFAATYGSESGQNGCPYNRICTGDIVLITMDTDLTPMGRELIGTRVRVAKDASDLSKGFRTVQQGGTNFHGFYYRVKPGKTYYFRAIYHYYKTGGKHTHFSRFTESFYYKSRGDIHNPGGGAEGPISPDEAKAMGLPPISTCVSDRSPGEFCTNQVVHIFWSNDRGRSAFITDIDLYINGKFVKNKHGPPHGGNFQEFYYVLPYSKYNGDPVAFQVTWKLYYPYLGQKYTHFENSQLLLSQYTPEWAFACKPADSWQKCQSQPQNKQ
ncbi:hypothetical protein [Endozoicomonas sp. 4G]|uniref:hypothetical protein n=1 Tax=Endozoicomonas sp. 4G TaxID=2872754 RepID=UPI002078BDDF|nr:hypothetical protein [Endozoicomonas sp. 4G]